MEKQCSVATPTAINFRPRLPPSDVRSSLWYHLAFESATILVPHVNCVKQILNYEINPLAPELFLF